MAFYLAWCFPLNADGVQKANEVNLQFGALDALEHVASDPSLLAFRKECGSAWLRTARFDQPGEAKELVESLNRKIMAHRTWSVPRGYRDFAPYEVFQRLISAAKSSCGDVFDPKVALPPVSDGELRLFEDYRRAAAEALGLAKDKEKRREAKDIAEAKVTRSMRLVGLSMSTEAAFDAPHIFMSDALKKLRLLSPRMEKDGVPGIPSSGFLTAGLDALVYRDKPSERPVVSYERLVPLLVAAVLGLADKM